MADSVRAAVRVAPNSTELQEFPVPSVPSDGALMEVLAAGICGTDVKMYRSDGAIAPVIMGHENIGVLAEVGGDFATRRGLSVGDVVFVEHYLPDMNCDWCHRGDFRHCYATDWRSNPSARRYGYTSSAHPPHLWGGFAQAMYLPWNAVLHKVPDHVSPELAGLATPLSNGIEWALNAGGVRPGSTIFIQGPGQQGLSQVVAARHAGASLTIVSGTEADSHRLEVARLLGADLCLNVDDTDPYEAVMDATAGRGVDVVVDCTAGAGDGPLMLGLDVLKRRGGTLVIQGNIKTVPDFPLAQLATKAAALVGARGHSYQACELAIELIASGRYPLELLTTHTFDLSQTHDAIEAVGGKGPPGMIHVSVLPNASPDSSETGTS